MTSGCSSSHLSTTQLQATGRGVCQSISLELSWSCRGSIIMLKKKKKVFIIIFIFFNLWCKWVNINFLFICHHSRINIIQRCIVLLWKQYENCYMRIAYAPYPHFYLYLQKRRIQTSLVPALSFFLSYSA